MFVFIRCVPASMRLKSIPVMFIMSTLVNNINDQLCGNVTVEEHDSCECGCPMKEEDCFVKGLQVIILMLPWICFWISQTLFSDNLEKYCERNIITLFLKKTLSKRYRICILRIIFWQKWNEKIWFWSIYKSFLLRICKGDQTCKHSKVRCFCGARFYQNIWMNRSSKTDVWNFTNKVWILSPQTVLLEA